MHLLDSITASDLCMRIETAGELVAQDGDIPSRPFRARRIHVEQALRHTVEPSSAMADGRCPCRRGALCRSRPRMPRQAPTVNKFSSAMPTVSATSE